MKAIDIPWNVPAWMDEYLQATRLVWGTATLHDAAVKIYYFCRDEKVRLQP